MIHKYYKPTTPSRRFFTSFFCIDNFIKKKNLYRLPIYKQKYLNLKRQKSLAGLRLIKKYPLFLTFKNLLKNTRYVAINFMYEKYKMRELILLQNIFSNQTIAPSLTTLFPGAVTMLYNASGVGFNGTENVNFLTQLCFVPFNAPLAYVQNLSRKNFTYSLSAGTSSTRIQSSKRLKLEKIQLPSGAYIMLTKYSLCLLGSLISFAKNKLILGKFGSYLKKKRVTKVRGVAMNPVDHPNGGRTKSKSPELSP